MNIELLRAVAAKWIEFPQTLDMEDWGGSVPPDDAHPCGAVGCFFGTAVLIADPSRFNGLIDRGTNSMWEKAGKDVLDLSFGQADILAYVRNWPPDFRNAYYASCPGSLPRAEMARDRLEHFIRTEGRE